MSARTRALLAMMRRDYARRFQVPIDDVETREFDEDGEVTCPSRPELPRWTVGELPPPKNCGMGARSPHGEKK